MPVNKYDYPYRDEPKDYDFEQIIYEKVPPLGRIILNAPEKRNPLGYERLGEIAKAAKLMELDDEIKVIIIKGAGPSFSAGYDITAVKPGEPQRNRPASGVYIHPDRDPLWSSYDHEHIRVYFTLWDLQKPVIAQIQGWCLAGGTELSAFCDLRIIADNARIGWPVSRNWSPGNIQYMPWLVGITKAKEYMFTAEPMDAQEALRVGWATRVYPLDKLEEETEKLAQSITLTDTDLIMITKRSINRQFEVMGFRTGCAWSADYLALAGLRPSRAARGGDEFMKIAQEKGVKAALDWREKTFGQKLRSSEESTKIKEGKS